MIVNKFLGVRRILKFTGFHIVWLILWSTAAVALHEYSNLRWLNIPWLPLSVMGTAVAFYVGFKNNSAYDRMWEARKIWGAIVNSSRAWGSGVKAFINNTHASDKVDGAALKEIHRRLIYRHIAWLYSLRLQLLEVVQWEHANQSGTIGHLAERYRKYSGLGTIKQDVRQEDLRVFLNDMEYEKLICFKNMATQLIDGQAQDLSEIHVKGLLDNFRHVELQQILYHFYEHQGKCERIKKFPLPRQYANMSFVFIWIFIFLLPFGMATEFSKLGNHGNWLAVPGTVLIGWIYVVMELIGDYSENPFQGMAYDIPMLSLCRTIEIDLREMLGETELPDPITSSKGVLM
ncbi:MAG: bestrophin family ion channel [Leeuwenhoekiella sp.]